MRFQEWAVSRWHGGRRPYWWYDPRANALIIYAERSWPTIISASRAVNAEILISYRAGWRAALANLLRNARRDVRMGASEMEGPDTAREMTPKDRRDEANFPMRAALMRLRLIEDKAVKMLPHGAVATELAEAIQGVVDLIRKGTAS
jgi:hypothetical protein